MDLGATVINYVEVLQLTHAQDFVDGVVAVDHESGEEHEIRARVVINATGVFTDRVRTMDDPSASPMVKASQGVHVAR